MAARRVHEIAINARILDALYAGVVIPGLQGWNDKAVALEETSVDWRRVAEGPGGLKVRSTLNLCGCARAVHVVGAGSGAACVAAQCG